MTPAEIGAGISIVALAFVSLVLSIIVFRKYRTGLYSYLWWGAGIFLGFVTILQEAVFYFGAWSERLMQSYIFLVALLVGLLSVGSVDLMKSKWVRAAWFGYVVLMSIATAYFSFTTPVGRDVVVNGVITGTLPAVDVISSTLVTAPGAIAIIVLALYSTLVRGKMGTLFIAAGGIVISISGAMFVLRSFPVTLYYAEFAGILLLFLGFIEFPSRNIERSGASAALNARTRGNR